MLFSKKWLRNHPKFLLHFLIHTDVLMLRRKFEPIPSSNFLVMSILKNWLILKIAKTIAHSLWPNFGATLKIQL